VRKCPLAYRRGVGQRTLVYSKHPGCGSRRAWQRWMIQADELFLWFVACG
jgi:hypothetical protein